MAALEESIAARGGRGAKTEKAGKGKKADKQAADSDAAAAEACSSEYADMSKAELLKLAARPTSRAGRR